MQPLTNQQSADLLEVIEDRVQRRSTIITSQLPVKHWHELLGDPTIADAILDRLVHNAHRFELRGETRRRPETGSLAIAEHAAKPAQGTKQPDSGDLAEKRRATTPVAAR